MASGRTGGNTTSTLTLPYWVRLARSNNLFTAYSAPNVGNAPGAWTQQGSATSIAMSNTVCLGLAAASGSATANGSAVLDNVTITPAPYNLGPLVNAGLDQTTINVTLTLRGAVSDDGLPNPPSLLTSAWSQVSGPAASGFGNASITNTTVTFPVSGAYQLRLIAQDGQVKTFDDTLLTVNLPLPTPPQILGFVQSGGGLFQFQLSNSTTTNYTGLVSTNLVRWEDLTAALRYSNGLYYLSDPAATNSPYRFYRLRWP